MQRLCEVNSWTIFFEKLAIAVVIVGLWYWDKVDFIILDYLLYPGCRRLVKPSFLSMKFDYNIEIYYHVSEMQLIEWMEIVT